VREPVLPLFLGALVVVAAESNEDLVIYKFGCRLLSGVFVKRLLKKEKNVSIFVRIVSA